MNDILFTKPNGETVAVPRGGFNFWALLLGVVYALFKQNYKFAACILVMALITMEIDSTGLITLLVNGFTGAFANKSNAYVYAFEKGYTCTDEEKEWIRNNCKPFGLF